MLEDDPADTEGAMGVHAGGDGDGDGDEDGGSCCGCCVGVGGSCNMGWYDVIGKYVGGAIEADLSESMILGVVMPEGKDDGDEGVWGGVNNPWGGAADEEVVVVVVLAVVVVVADEVDEEGTSAGESMGREEVVAVTSEAPNVRLTVSVVAAPEEDRLPNSSMRESPNRIAGSSPSVDCCC